MKKLFTILVMLVAMSVNAQWVVQTSGITANLYDVKFINRYTGWTLGDGGNILKTTNGGINWMNIPNPSIIGGGILSSIFPVDSLYCYVVGGHDVILKTTNGGTNWIEIRNGNPNGGIFNGVYFLNRNTGWFCGDYRVMRTTNGGVSFDSTTVSYISLSDIYFKDSNTGLMCDAGVVLKTTNGGMNWFDTNVPTNGWAYEFRRISVVNNQYIYVVAGRSPPYRSTDFGTTWQVLDSLHTYPPAVMYCCSFANINTGYVGGTYGYLYKTTNGGINFARQNTGTDQRFWGTIYCFNDSVVWGVGGAGKIMHTTTGGQWLVGISNNENEIPLKYSLSQNYPNPFNPSTKIKFDVASSPLIPLQRGTVVVLKVYDMLGREVQTLVNESLKPGTYEVTFDGSSLNTGVYFYKLITGDYTNTKRMLLIK